MSNNHKKVLAIDPGTREMGIAFLDDGKLIYYGVKAIKKRKYPHQTLKEGRKIILRLIKDFRPNTLIYEKAFFANNRNSSLLNVFVDEIKAVAKRKGLELKGFAPSTVKKAICGNGRASKREVARVIASKYLELKVYLNQDRVWKELYHENMFDAAALGMMAEINC